MEHIYDVIIVGSGPAGLTAAIYNTRANLSTLVLAGRKWGGQLMLTTEVENFPGFPEGIMGPELMMRMRKQAEHHGAKIIDVDFKSAEYGKRPFEVVDDNGNKYYSKSIIIATGADTRWLHVPGEKEKIGRGVSSCAPCDAAFYRGKKVIVVGGGDSAMEEALVLTKFASHVFLVHRKKELRASEIMQRRAKEHEKITFLYNTTIEEIVGEQKVEKVVLKTMLENEKIPGSTPEGAFLATPEELEGAVKETASEDLVWEFPVDGIFVAIGHIPNSAVFEGIETNEKGFIKAYPGMRTNKEGVFVAGDVHDQEYEQGITAAAFGCMAAMEVEKWLLDQEDIKVTNEVLKQEK